MLVIASSLLLAAIGLLLGGCAAPWQRLDAIAMQGGFQKRIVSGRDFAEVVYQRPWANGSSGPLIVFLEGDGLPWSQPRRISSDPTTRHPVALELAIQTPGQVAYLARPCYQEFVHAAGCSPASWTSERYSAQIVASLSAALMALDPGGIQPIWLVGYSGGGALAVLIAPHVPAVERVITVAGNLDTEAWTKKHGYLSLSGSLNPVTAGALPTRIRQVHLVGTRDTNVLPEFTQRFAAVQTNAHVRAFEGFDHVCCWVERWREIWSDIAR
jgi:pimeloyl-ACP methyl ester carboxylesterase